MLSGDDLESWLSSELDPPDKLLILLSTFNEPCQVKDIVTRAREAGYRFDKSANISRDLGKLTGLAVRNHKGWKLLKGGQLRLADLGVAREEQAPARISFALREHLGKVSNSTTLAFIREAIEAYEHKLYRSAIVMSWIAAMDVLYNEVCKHHLAEFNTEAVRVYPKWKQAKNSDDLAIMGERDFLDRLAAISVVGKNVKIQLQACLDLRNGCGHPNSLKTGPSVAAHHIETLIQNVFQEFS